MRRLHRVPFSAIHPLPEYLATGRRKLWYEEIKAGLQVPWMGVGVVTMALAHYPAFFETLWGALKPLVGSASFVQQATEMRRLVETRRASRGQGDARGGRAVSRWREKG
jgi:hypothetical protein